MGHKCGPSCYRKQGRRSECDSCNRSKANRRKTLDAGGKRRHISLHLLNDLRNNRREEITRERVAYVLDNWTIRGVNIEHQTMNYLAFVPEVDTVIRVAVSLDDSRIVTAYPDRTAAIHLSRGTFAYFTNKLANMEVRNEPTG